MIGWSSYLAVLTSCLSSGSASTANLHVWKGEQTLKSIWEMHVESCVIKPALLHLCTSFSNIELVRSSQLQSARILGQMSLQLFSILLF